MALKPEGLCGQLTDPRRLLAVWALVAGLSACGGGSHDRSAAETPGRDAAVSDAGSDTADASPDLPQDTSGDAAADAAPDDAADATDAGRDVPLDTNPADADVSEDTPDTALPRACNGHPALCERRLDEITLATTHNAMSNEAEGWLGPNQQFGITRQLEDGVRGMMLDTHRWNGDLYLCHTVCNFGNKLLVDGLREIAAFLETHPDEVMAIIFQDGISAEETAGAFEDSGLIEYVYTHDPQAPWPTLGAMIDSNQRLLATAESSGPPPAWYHHAWDIVFDTPYNFDRSEAFSCELNRGQASNDLFLINHWITVILPSPDGAAEVNQYEPLLARARACEEEQQHHPNFLAVDFYATGDLFAVVDELNGVAD